MTRKEQYLWFGLFAIGTIAYTVVQDTIRPASAHYSEIAKYLLGVAPNYFAGICLPSFFMAMIAQMIHESVKRGRAGTKQKAMSFRSLRTLSLRIAIPGLLIWETVQLASKNGHFDPQDILWTMIGAATFEMLYRIIHKPAIREHAVSELAFT